MALQQQPVNVTVQLPEVDLTKLIPDLVLPFLAKLSQVVADALDHLWSGIVGSGFNVLTRTAPEWIYQQKDVAALANDLVPAINGITALAVVLAGIGLIGREFWGWSWGPVESGAKIALGVVLGLGAIRLCTWSIDLVDHVNDGLGGVTLAKPPGVLITGSVLDTLVSALLLIPWFLCGLWLYLLMVERLGMLVVLFIISPVALGVWGIPQARWFTIAWVRFWVGWLIGQPVALLCLKLASVLAGLFGGGSTAVFFGIAMLLTARKAATLFVAGGSRGRLGRHGCPARDAGAVSAALSQFGRSHIVGQVLSEFFISIATWLLNVAMLWVAISIAAMGFTLICTAARPFAHTRKKRGT